MRSRASPFPCAVLGDTTFHGAFDNVTFWDHAFPANSIATLYNCQASGYEMGLILNMPFEYDRPNINGELQTVFCPMNVAYKALEDGGYAALDTVSTEKDCTAELLEQELKNPDTINNYVSQRYGGVA